MTRLLALLCLSAVWQWPAMARAEDDRESVQRVDVELLRVQLRLLELEAHVRTLDAIEAALVARATAQLALVQWREVPVCKPRSRRWDRASFALGMIVGTAAGAVIGAGLVLGR